MKISEISVGSLPPNALGLYEMSGNVNEWCQDAFKHNYYETSPKLNPFCEKGEKVPINNKYYGVRIFRGGSSGGYASECRVSYRVGDYASVTSNVVGFRVVI